MNASSSTAALVSVRIENGSDVDLSEVLVFFPDQPSRAVNYGAIQQGAVSAYQHTNRAYRYAHIEAKAGNRTLVLRPIDYVGEKELPAGQFTYVVTIQGEQLRVDLRQDE